MRPRSSRLNHDTAFFGSKGPVNEFHTCRGLTPSRGAKEEVKLAEMNVIPREQNSLQENPGPSSTVQLKCDGTRAETRFRLSSKRTNPFKSAGGGVSSVDY